MKILGQGTETYLFLNGVAVTKPLQLTEDIQLLPASCSPDPIDIVKGSTSEFEIGVKTIFLHNVVSQLHIRAEDSKTLAVKAWNSLWDAILIAGLFDCEAVCNFQSSSPAEKFQSDTELHVTNHHLRGGPAPAYTLTSAEQDWLEENFISAKTLMEEERFQAAIHALATYRWHPQPRAQLALLWAGIEGLFKIDSELVFRLSLCAAALLSDDDKLEKQKLFEHVKSLYKQRSAAVHGSKIKGSPQEAVQSSKELLQKLVRKCIVVGKLPDCDELCI